MIKDRWLLPCTDGSPTKQFAAGSHLGVDFGWCDVAYSDILAIEKGKVVDKFYSSTCGYSVVLQHDYSDGTHRWSGYIHLKQQACVSIGDQVTQGQKIGVKGNTGNSNGVHLHLYVSDCTSAVYTWNRMKSLCTFDPLPHLYRTKAKTYAGVGLNARPYIEDLEPEVVYPSPVNRDESIKQVEVLIDYLFMRNSAGGTAYDEYCTKGIYTVKDEKVSGNYTWYLIDTINGNEFWVASGGTRTKDLMTDKAQIAELKKQVESLSKDITNLKLETEQLSKEKEELQTQINTLEVTKKELEESNTKLEEENTAKQTKIDNAKTALE